MGTARSTVGPPQRGHGQRGEGTANAAWSVAGHTLRACHLRTVLRSTWNRCATAAALQPHQRDDLANRGAADGQRLPPHQDV